MNGILVVYASAGMGHRIAASSVYAELKQNCPQQEIKLLDILDYTNFFFSRAYSGGYYFLASHLRSLWLILYTLCANRYIASAFHFFCRLNSLRFLKYIVLEKPKVVLTTHFFPSEAVAYLKRKNKISSRLITIITDFGVHPLWVLPDIDGYIVAGDYARDELLRRGISEDKIKVFGIPVRPGFLTETPASRQEFTSLESPTIYSGDEVIGFTLLLTTGSFGLAVTEKIIRELKDLRVRLLVVCGNNQRLYQRLRRANYKSVVLFGFTKEIPQLMAQSDLIIIKPGGLSIAEAVAMERPLIFIDGIPGQETENARILERCGCAIRSKHLSDIKTLILDLQDNPRKLSLMRQNTRKLKKVHPAREISKYVCPRCF